MTELSFLEVTASYDIRLETMIFQAVDGRRRVRCVIGAKALQEQFGAQGRAPQQLIAAFQRGRREIRRAAKRKYAAIGHPVAELVLTARDFATENGFERTLAKHLRLQPEEPA